MRNIQNILEAKKRERAESGDAGFSLIELIVVVVILAILAAIAIPIFLGIQTTAKTNALKGIAGNAASAVAADIGDGTSTPLAGGGAAVPTAIYKADPGATVTLTAPASGTVTLDNFCVTATAVATGTLAGGTAATSGPGC